MFPYLLKTEPQRTEYSESQFDSDSRAIASHRDTLSRCLPKPRPKLVRVMKTAV